MMPYSGVFCDFPVVRPHEVPSRLFSLVLSSFPIQFHHHLSCSIAWGSATLKDRILEWLLIWGRGCTCNQKYYKAWLHLHFDLHLKTSWIPKAVKTTKENVPRQTHSYVSRIHFQGTACLAASSQSPAVSSSGLVTAFQSGPKLC